MTRSRTQAATATAVSPRLTRSRAKASTTDMATALPKPKTVSRKVTRKKSSETKLEVDEGTEYTVTDSVQANEMNASDASKFDSNAVSIPEENSLGLRGISTDRAMINASPTRSSKTISVSPHELQSIPEKLIEQESMIMLRESSFESILPESDEHLHSPKEKAQFESRLPLKDTESLTRNMTTLLTPVKPKSLTSRVPDQGSLIPSPAKAAVLPNVVRNVKDLTHESPSNRPHNVIDSLVHMPSSLSEVADDRQHSRAMKRIESVSELDDGPTHEELRLLKAEIKKLKDKNAVLISQQSKLLQEVESSVESERQLRQELNEMKEIVDMPQKEALQESYNLLISKYESTKKDVSNFQMQIDKLKTEVKKLTKENQKLMEEIDEKNDSLEIALIDKCMAEEQVEIQRAKEEELQRRIEELSLELDLAHEHHFEPAGIRRADMLDHDRLVEALIKLRDVSTQKEQELKEKLSERNEDLERLKRIEEAHSALQQNLQEATNKVEYLKEQLDEAHESSDLVLKLTETNLNLDEVRCFNL
jgi:predicted nuclease with TOPRIM domain